MTEKKSTPRKSAAKKAAPRKAAAKKTAESSSTPSTGAAHSTPDKDSKDVVKAEVEPKAKSSNKPSVEEVAGLLLDGSTRWGTGRDRDTNLESEGYDLDEVRVAVEVERGKRIADEG